MLRGCIQATEEGQRDMQVFTAYVLGPVGYQSMQNFDQAILALCKQDLVTIDEATKWVTNVEEFKMRLRGITPGSAAAPSGAKADIQRFGT